MLEEEWWTSVHTLVEDVQAERDRLMREIDSIEEERYTAIRAFESIGRLPVDRSWCTIKVWFGWDGHCYVRSLDKETLEMFPVIERPYMQGMSRALSHNPYVDIEIEGDCPDLIESDSFSPVAQQLFDDAKHIRDISRRLCAKQNERLFFNTALNEWRELTGHVLRDDFFSED